MKKVIFFVLTCISFSACKKDYTCSCAYNGEEFYKVTITNAGKSKAKDACAERKDSFSYKGDGVSCNL